MAQLQSSCILGTLSLSASNASAQNSIIIGGASNNTEFSNYSQCNLIAIGENTALSGSGGLDGDTLTETQAGSFNFPEQYVYYYGTSNQPSFVLTSASSAGGSGASFSTNFNRGSNINPTVTLNKPGSGYTASLTITLSDSGQSGETCKIFTISPMTSTDVINIGNNAGCRAQGSNNIRIGACAAPGNFSSGTHLHSNSIAIGKNTMHSGSFINSVVVGHCSLTGNLANKTGNSAKICNTTIVGNCNEACIQSGICSTTILGSCNATGSWDSSLHYSTIVGTDNAKGACYLQASVIIGCQNVQTLDSCKRGPSSGVIIGTSNFRCAAYSTGNIAIGGINFYNGIIRNANCNVGIGCRTNWSLTTGTYNVAMGYGPACCLTTGRCGIYLGSSAGRGNCTGTSSVFIGSHAACGMSNQNDSIFIGPFSGRYGSSTQGGHVVVGAQALRNMCAGYFNIALGYEALYAGGQSSTSCAINGGCNIALGYRAGECTVAGSNNNIYIGQRTGLTSRGSETYKFYLGQGSGNPLMCGCLASSGKYLAISGSIDFSDYTSTSVASPATASLNPNQNNQAPTYDTLATLAVDPSGNVVRAEQEGTWTFTKAQLDGPLNRTLIEAPGANKVVIITESDWMIKYSAAGAVSTNQSYDIRQASNTNANAVVSTLPGTRINEVMSSSQGTVTNPSYGFVTRDVPLQTRTYKTNTATTINKKSSETLPSGFISLTIKLKYRLYDATTFD